MSAPMEVNKTVTEEVPLDLTVKKDDKCDVSRVEVERDGPEKLTMDAELVPLDLSVRSVSLLQSPQSLLPSRPPSPPSKPQPQFKMDSPSPMMVTEHLKPLHEMYANASPNEHMTSSIVVPEYNPILSVFPISTDTQFQQNNYIQNQMQQMHLQKQQQLNQQQQQQQQLNQQQQQLNQQQQQLQLQLQYLQLQATYGGILLDPSLKVSSSPVYAATSLPSSSEPNHFPFSGFDGSFSKPADGFGYPYALSVAGGAYGGVDVGGNQSDCPSPELPITFATTTDDHLHQQQLQCDLDREYRSSIGACAKDDVDFVDPEEVAAIYRQSEYLWFRQRYMEIFEESKKEKMRRSRNDKNNNSSSSIDNDDHDLTPEQQQYNQTYMMKRQTLNEASKRSWDAKHQRYVENQTSVNYLSKKVNEMKNIKRRLLKANSNILAE